MGRIVRRFARFWEQELRGNFKQGEWLPAVVVPIAQYEAGQRLHEVVLAANALGGAARAGYFACQVVAAAVGTIAALHARMQVPSGIVVTGDTYGVHIEQELVDGTITGTWEGIRLEMYSDATAVIANVYGIFMTNYIQSAPVGNYYFQRMSENGGVTVDAAFYISVGGAGDITNLFYLAGAHTAWSAVTVPPGAQVGRIAVNVGGVQLYIPLWN